MFEIHENVKEIIIYTENNLVLTGYDTENFTDIKELIKKLEDLDAPLNFTLKL